MASPNFRHPAEGAKRPFRRTRDADPALVSHSFPLRVYYEDTDAAGMVYHANYLKFAERGRSEMLRGLGFGHRRLAGEDGIGFAVRRCSVDYLVPARLEDALTVDTTLAGIGGATLALRQQIRRDGELLVDLDILVACIGRDGRPRRLPSALRAVLAEPRAP
ncbi:MAG TPA: tol-pal system-associated acyl-CoA thioesterase [Stellaceae bacterium]|nr:tol-pal system-associated acyl-CoA thioesterase [Stellaceae bacterium]